jgi:hypothetical protein
LIFFPARHALVDTDGRGAVVDPFRGKALDDVIGDANSLYRPWLLGPSNVLIHGIRLFRNGGGAPLPVFKRKRPTAFEPSQILNP